MTMSHESSMELFNPFLPEYLSDPYPAYRRLRATDPVHRSFLGIWFVSKYEDCVAVLRNSQFGTELNSQLRSDSRTLRADAPGKSPLERILSNIMAFNNPPRHTRLRSETAKACHPHMTSFAQAYTERIINGLIDDLPKRGRVDFVKQVVERLPVSLVLSLMGLPREDERKLHKLSVDIARSFDPFRSQSFYQHVNQVVVEFEEYLARHIRRRQQNPTDDMLSSLIAQSEKAGKLDPAELLATCMLMFVAGSETTVSLIAVGLLSLFRHPEQMERVRVEPDLIGSAVEEMARYDGPFGFLTRVALEDLQVGEKIIRSGEQVSVLLQSANHDPDVFTEPEKFDVRRQPNPHIAFGAGIHHCLGAATARTEAQTAFRVMLERLPHMRLEEESVQWRDTRGVRGIDSYIVHIE